MSTTKQIQASRANGAKSKGPVTPQGKHNSSRNSIRHGLLAETIVLEAEDKAPFLELVNDLIETHQPCTRTEFMLVETIAAARWRQDRIWGMQKVAFDYDVATESVAKLNPLRAVLALRNSPESARVHELLLRYETAFDRQISRALLRLQQLQARDLPASRTPADLPEESAKREGGSIGSSAKTPSAARTRQPIEAVTQPDEAVTQAHVAITQPPPPTVQIPKCHGVSVSERPQSRPPTRSLPAQAVSPQTARRKPGLPRKKPAA